MRAGKLQHRVVIEQATTTKSATGAPVVTWAEYKQVWAEARPMSGDEVLRSVAEVAQGTTIFSIRYRRAVNPKMRLLWQDRVFDIQQVIDVGGRGREMELLGTEVIR